MCIRDSSTIGSSRLNFRVRDGNGCDPVDKITGKVIRDLKINDLRFQRSLVLSLWSLFVSLAVNLSEGIKGQRPKSKDQKIEYDC